MSSSLESGRKPNSVWGELGTNPFLRFRPEQLEKHPPCQASCPSGVDIRGWIAIIAQHEKMGLTREEACGRAWEAIAAVDPFPATLGRICPHPCEANCNRSDKDGAVAINAMERFVGDWALERGLPLPVLEGGRQPESIGVVGAGPAGLSFAFQMARRGYAVTVFERASSPGGMLRHGIPAYRLPEEVLVAEIQRILDLGVELELDMDVGRDIFLPALWDRFGALFLGIGAQRPQRLNIPGEDGPGVLSGTTYLGLRKSGQPIDLGWRVTVIGGGNTAIYAARSARRDGAEVVLLYRRTRAEMPAAEGEIEDALIEGVRIECLRSPLAINRDGDAVVSLRVQEMHLGEPDASGRPRPVPVDGSRYDLETGAVIIAISQVSEWDALGHVPSNTAGRALDRDGKMDQRMWTGGDALGLGIASRAIGQGRIAAEAVHAELRGLPPPEPLPSNRVEPGQVKTDYYQDRTPVAKPRRPADEWLAHPDLEIDRTIGRDSFFAEAERCLSCGLCFGCQHCWMYCNPAGYVHLEVVAPGAYFALNLEKCEGCGKCIEVCPCGFLSAALDAVT